MNSSSLKEISQNILNMLRGGRSSNNEHLSIEQVQYLIKYYRATFIRRDQKRNLNRSRMFEQDLGEVSLETVNEGDLLKRTVDPIPTPIRLHRNEGITHVGCNKYTEGIPVVDAHRALWNSHSKYTADTPEAFYRDGYIYIKNDIVIPNINVRGIFEDPQEVFQFTMDNGLEIYDENSPYPISDDMLEGITKAIIKGELQMAVQSPNDTEANNRQDVSQQQ